VINLYKVINKKVNALSVSHPQDVKIARKPFKY